MKSLFLQTSQREAARIAGVGYLVIIACGIFAEFFVRSTLIESGDAAATAEKIVESESLFRASIAGDLVMLIFDVIVGVALYILLRPVSQTLALLATAFRLIHTAVYGATLLSLTLVVELLTADYLTVVDGEQTHALALALVNLHAHGYALGLVFFAVHVLVLGYLVWTSGYFPKVLGALLLVASAGYLVDSFAHVLLTNYADYETVFALVVFAPAFIAELSLALWLLIKGANVGSNDEASFHDRPWGQLRGASAAGVR